jgi:hypothetical protein
MNPNDSPLQTNATLSSMITDDDHDDHPSGESSRKESG